jgi:hypothetical protein
MGVDWDKKVVIKRMVKDLDERKNWSELSPETICITEEVFIPSEPGRALWQEELGLVYAGHFCDGIVDNKVRKCCWLTKEYKCLYCGYEATPEEKMAIKILEFNS